MTLSDCLRSSAVVAVGVDCSPWRVQVGAKDVQVNFVADSEYPICGVPTFSDVLTWVLVGSLMDEPCR